jgi:hypothetical protein
MTVNQGSRTYTWEDPMALQDAGAGLSGLDYLKAVFGRKLPQGTGKLLAHGTTTCLVFRP